MRRNAWVMRGNSGQRLPLTASSDLDGHVFDLSADGQWVLYTREVTNSDKIFNTLWAVSTAPITPTRTNTQTNPISIRLPVSNVLYAEWSPVQPRQLAYSTADRIARAPGWQANNDLWLMSFGLRAFTRQYVFTPTLLLDASSGGLYGWWGTGYAFAPDGQSIAYARTDSIGLVNFSLNPRKPATATVTTSELLPISAYNTHSDWAWYPTMRWSPDGHDLYTITHAPPIGLEAAEDSPAFDVAALLVPEPDKSVQPHPARRHVCQPDAGAGARQRSRRARLSAWPFCRRPNPNNSPHTTYRLGRDGPRREQRAIRVSARRPARAECQQPGGLVARRPAAGGGVRRQSVAGRPRNRPNPAGDRRWPDHQPRAGSAKGAFGPNTA